MDLQESTLFCRGQMAPDEHVLWQGKPEKGNWFNLNTIIPMLVPLGVAGFLLYSMRGNFNSGSHFLFMPLIFVGIILIQAIRQFASPIYYRKHSVYVITNKRIYRKRGKYTDNLSATNMPSYETIMYPNGCGTIRFLLTSDPYQHPRYRSRVVHSYFTLENLADVERVQQLINTITAENRS